MISKKALGEVAIGASLWVAAGSAIYTRGAVFHPSFYLNPSAYLAQRDAQWDAEAAIKQEQTRQEYLAELTTIDHANDAKWDARWNAVPIEDRENGDRKNDCISWNQCSNARAFFKRQDGFTGYLEVIGTDAGQPLRRYECYFIDKPLPMQTCVNFDTGFTAYAVKGGDGIWKIFDQTGKAAEGTTDQ
jgi:hypothetical protein